MFWGCFRGVKGGVTSDITLPCSLTVYYPNYSEIKRNSHLFLKNPKWLPNTSHDIYIPWCIAIVVVYFWGVDLPEDLGVDLPNLNSSWPVYYPNYSEIKNVSSRGGRSASSHNIYMSIWTLTVEMWICYSWPLNVSTRGVDLPVDLPIWTLTSTLHVKQIWALILEICYCHLEGVLRMFQGCVTSDITLPCSLTVYYPNYSEIKRNSHLFLQNPKWLPNTSYNIYTMMHCNCCCLFLGGICQIWTHLDQEMSIAGGFRSAWQICQYELSHPHYMLNLANMSSNTWNLLLSFRGCFRGVLGC